MFKSEIGSVEEKTVFGGESTFQEVFDEEYDVFFSETEKDEK